MTEELNRNKVCGLCEMEHILLNGLMKTGASRLIRRLRKSDSNIIDVPRKEIEDIIETLGDIRERVIDCKCNCPAKYNGGNDEV